MQTQQLKDKAGGPMMLQKGVFASVLRFDNEAIHLAPRGSKWSDSGMPSNSRTNLLLSLPLHGA
jgi:hypothetical protein